MTARAMWRRWFGPAPWRLGAEFGPGRERRGLGWVAACMVCLAGLVAGAAWTLADHARRFQSGLDGTLTVELTAAGASGQREAMVMDQLRLTPGVREVALVPRERALALIEPWLGDIPRGAELPLPVLIDVTLDDGAALDLTALEAELRDLAPGARIDDHGGFRATLDGLTRLAIAVALGAIGLIGLAAIGTVVITTRSALGVQRDTIEVLHLIGAADGDVARAFARETGRRALLGGAMGMAAAIALALVLALLGAPIAWLALPALGLTLPLFAAVIAATTARRTVLRALARQP